MIDVHDAIRISRLTDEQRAYLRILSRTRPKARWKDPVGFALLTIGLTALVLYALEVF